MTIGMPTCLWFYKQSSEDQNLETSSSVRAVLVPGGFRSEATQLHAPTVQHVYTFITPPAITALGRVGICNPSWAASSLVSSFLYIATDSAPMPRLSCCAAQLAAALSPLLALPAGAARTRCRRNSSSCCSSATQSIVPACQFTETSATTTREPS